MKISKKILHSLVMLCIIMACVSCESPDELYDDKETVSKDYTESLVINDDLVNVLSEIKFINNSTHIMAQTPALLLANNGIYLFDDTYAEIYHLNKATGYFTGLCADPLCNHKIRSCINSYVITSATVYQDTIYVLGGYTADNGTGIWFIGYYDFEKQEYIFWDQWDEIVGYDYASSIQIVDQYLYYMKKESEVCKNVWRISLQGKSKPELVSSGNDQFICGFTISGEYLYYTYLADDSVYYSDLEFENQKLYSDTEIIGTKNMAIIDGYMVRINDGFCDTSWVKWDEGEVYQPSDTPFGVYINPIGKPDQLTQLTTHIMNAEYLSIHDNYIMTLPDCPTYITTEIVKGEKKHYVNKNSSHILVGKITDTELVEIDLSKYLGMNYTISQIPYFDENNCIIEYRTAYTETENEGYYLICNYRSESPEYYKLEFTS